MSVTAVVLSARSYSRRFPGLEVAVHRSVITNAAQMQAARFDAIVKVRTSHFFYLDDDDDLPDDYLDVLRECVDRGAALTYTDELVKRHDGGPAEVRLARPYSQAEHIQHALLVHHLALCETAAARAAVARIPRGHYWPEFQLFWELAKRGVAYVPRVGYVWDRKLTGLHLCPWTAIAQMQSRLWGRRDMKAT